MERLAAALGMSTTRMLVLGWAVSALLLVGGLLLLLTGTAPVGGIVLFVLGAASATTVAVGLLRVKARPGIRESRAGGTGPGGPETPGRTGRR